MATATTSTEFVGLLFERICVGKDKETDIKKHRLSFRKMVFSDAADRIKQTTFIYLEDEPELKNGLRYNVSASYDEDMKRWVIDSIDRVDDLEFEAKFVSVRKWKKHDDTQLWKFNLQGCLEIENTDKHPWPNVGTFFYENDDEDDLKELKKNVRYKFCATYSDDQKCWEITSWDDI